MSEKLPKFKPIYTNPDKSVVFQRNLDQLQHKPIIIFHDDFNDKYYYIKARSAYDGNGFKKKPYQGEIFVPTANKGLLTKDSYVYTTQIFSIKRIDLEKIVNKDSHTFLTTRNFSKNQIREISQSLMNNLRKDMPFVSWIEVKLDDNNKPISTLKYCHESYVREITKDIMNVEQKQEIEQNILNNLNQDEITLMNLKSLGAEVKANLKDFEHTWEDDYQEEQQESKKFKDDFELTM
ncbi:Mbov_0400 family ICE element protein [Mycoplasmopsis cricetuli]|uniref:Mbov_0400 family ICE element protein n=1 Tax=Mycoplasmopsis cricetuli TaxID=171283 RepID=UPI00046E8509|nr:hypothetical protein [Mycoplasmopsis cricetuli]